MSCYFILLISLFVLFYLALIFESMAFALAGFALLSFGVISFIYIVISSRFLRFRPYLPVAVAEKGRQFNFYVQCKSDMPLPPAKAAVKLEYREQGSRKKKKVWLKIDSVPNGLSRTAFRLGITRAGAYEFTLKKCRLYDMTGLFFITKKARGSVTTMVMPEINQVPLTVGEGVRNFFGETVAYDEFQSGDNPEEIFDVREFRDGDKLQRVHWKLTARLDEIMVKEHSLPKTCPIVLLLPPGSSIIEEELELAAGLSFSLMDQKCPHFAAWYSKSRKDVVRVRVESEESFYIFITAYMRDCATEGNMNMLEKYREKYRGENFLHVLMPVSSGELMVDGVVQEHSGAGDLEMVLR